MLPDGRFAVVGGVGADGTRRADGEVFEFDAAAATGRWLPLEGAMAVGRAMHALVAVPGGMIAIGGDQQAAPAELSTRRAGDGSRCRMG